MKTGKWLPASLCWIAGAGTIVLLAALAGCDGEDETPPSIVGEWTLVSEAATGCRDPLDNYSENIPCTATDCTRVTFTADGRLTITLIQAGVTETESGTYTITGDRLTMCFPAPVGCDDPVTIKVERTRLTLTYVSATDGCTETQVLSRP
jgi:hypothetical protein